MRIWQKIKGLISSEITKNSATLLSASIIVQIIGLLVYPILTRLYAPEDFGLFNLFLSIAGVLSIFATAEFQYSIVLPKQEKTAVACFHLGIICSILVSFILFGILPFASTLTKWFNVPELSEWFWAIPIFVFLSALWTLLSYWFTRHKQFGNVSRYQITQCVCNAGAKCGFGFAGFLNGGLILSAIISPFIALGISISTTYKQSIKSLLHFNTKECRTALSSYSNFPKYSLPRAFINYFSGNLPIMLLTPFFGLTEIGFWGMALTLAFTPIMLISNSLYHVLYQKIASEVQSQNSIITTIHLFLKNSFLIFVPLFVMLYFILPNLVSFLLGNGWEQTSLYIQIMLCWCLLTFVGNTLSFLPDVFHKQRKSAGIEVILFVARLSVLCLSIHCHNFTLAIVLYCIVSCIILIWQTLWYYSLAKQYENQGRSK